MMTEDCTPHEACSAIRRECPAVWARLYENLLELAAAALQHEQREHAPEPTVLVHEAFLRLHDDSFLDDAHFLSVAARTFRNVIVDRSRRRRAARRGGGWRRVRYDHAELAPSSIDDRLLISEALDGLRSRHRRARQTVELRIFRGMSMAEIARVLDVSPRTVDLDWRFARMWLQRALDERARPARTRRASQTKSRRKSRPNSRDFSSSSDARVR